MFCVYRAVEAMSWPHPHHDIDFYREILEEPQRPRVLSEKPSLHYIKHVQIANVGSTPALLIANPLLVRSIPRTHTRISTAAQLTMTTTSLREQWARTLSQRFSSWYMLLELDKTDLYVKSMISFHVFTNRIVAALTLDETQGQSLIQPGVLHKLYKGIPSLNTRSNYEAFRKWVRNATLKHPQRRTREQHQWFCIVDMLEKGSISDVTLIVDSAIKSSEIWEQRTYDLDNLLVDWDATGTHYLFRNKHAVKDANTNVSDHGESCWICANDFDTDVHRPQQGPCGHYQCRECFENALEYAATKYTCAFCRACLICGASACEDHVLPRKTVPPTPLDQILRNKHMLCTVDQCRQAEALSGLSPKQFWLLREKTRSIRTNHADIFRHFFSNRDPQLATYLAKSLKEIEGTLQAEVERVKLVDRW